MAKYEPRDRFYRQARAKGLPSRAAFKIEELLAKVKIPTDARVIDLGCAPGGWLAILGRVVGDKGRVIGIDLAPCGNFGASVETLVADIRDASLPALLNKSSAVTLILSPAICLPS